MPFDADADVLKLLELPCARGECFHPHGVVFSSAVHHLDEQATDRQMVMIVPLRQRFKKGSKGYWVGAREGIGRVWDMVCFIVYLAAAS